MSTEGPSISPGKGEGVAIARAWLSENGESIVAEQVELARIPSPPFGEFDRAEAVATKLRELGADPDLDEIGNVTAWYPPRGDSATGGPVIVAAHLDSVFGPEVPIEIHGERDVWTGPGVADNARGLAVTLAVFRALVHARATTHHPILFAFTVGEEGRGDLRGVKHLLRDGSPLTDAAAFIAVDCSGLRRIVHNALGSRRFRITVSGPGGHSWTDWGRVNPANAIAEFIHRLLEFDLPLDPRTTLTVARLGGGTSINAIPAESWVELDVRSEANETLRDIELQIREALATSITEQEDGAEGSLTAAVELIGERPAGKLPAEHPLVQAADEATREIGVEPELGISSTDANVPQALGIPAIALGAGGRSGDTHTVNEWFEDTDGAAGALRLLYVLSAVAGF
ncbi:MAG: M20/M25/M40 family metallo-hydrolase [Gemmatimonadetes bacterium]|nr:M20/M25/M40 family metallo-hydrolase [Gemmatimonadota bacterium]NIO30518.1 M20/M25/M40 family metallo-hydrolase [Gemmatimonadota bacterium]